jgi:hypothetical protein
MSARATLITTLTSLLAVSRRGRMDAHRAEAERLFEEALRETARVLSEGLVEVAESGQCCVSQVDGVYEAAGRLADDFDGLLRASEERAAAKREARTYPYDLEVR